MTGNVPTNPLAHVCVEMNALLAAVTNNASTRKLLLEPEVGELIGHIFGVTNAIYKLSDYVQEFHNAESRISPALAQNLVNIWGAAIEDVKNTEVV